MAKTQPSGASATPILIPPLFPWQQKVKAALAANRFVAVSSARQIGKTQLAVLLAIDAALRGGAVWWVAPNYKLTNPGYDLLRKLVQQEPFKKIVNEYKQRRHFTFRNGDFVGTIEIISADDPTQVVGATLDLAVIDEAARMHQDAWYEGVYSTLTVKRGKALLISNPRGKNWFWELWRRGDPDAPEYDPEYRSFTFSQHDNPLVTLEDIERQHAQMPERKFQREVLGMFTDDGGEVFVGVRKVATVTPNLPPLCVYNPDHIYYAGLDFGSRQDYTCIVVFDLTEMAQVAMYRFTAVRWDEQRENIATVQEYWNARLWDVEENAAGAVMIESLRALNLPIRAFNTNRWTKREIIESWADAIELGRVRLLNDEAIIREHEAYESEVTDNNTVKFSAPAGMHDDTVIASALAYRAATVRDEVEIRQPLRFLPFRGLYGDTRTRERRKYR